VFSRKHEWFYLEINLQGVQLWEEDFRLPAYKPFTRIYTPSPAGRPTIVLELSYLMSNYQTHHFHERSEELYLNIRSVKFPTKQVQLQTSDPAGGYLMSFV
jgi:hypothetical protein